MSPTPASGLKVLFFRRNSSRNEGLARPVSAARARRVRPATTRSSSSTAEHTSEPVERAAIVACLAHKESLFPWRLAGTTAAARAELGRSRDVAQRCLAAELAAEVHDLDAVPRLIDGLDDPDPRVQRSAAQALRSMAHTALDDAELWTEWFEREQAWWGEQAEGLFQDLTAVHPGTANAALRTLAQHPLHRHEAAERIAQSLPNQPEPCSVGACLVLEKLGSRAALPGLVHALEQGTPPLRDAAWKALRTLTGEELPLDAEAWRTLLEQ